jgi:hypothetical protein
MISGQTVAEGNEMNKIKELTETRKLVKAGVIEDR